METFMLKVTIEKNGMLGAITWNEESPKHFKVTFDCKNISADIIKHFMTAREFYFPESQSSVRKHFPTENNCFFELALDMLTAATGVTVHR